MTLAPTLTTLDTLKVGQSATVIHLAPTAQDGVFHCLNQSIIVLGCRSLPLVYYQLLDPLYNSQHPKKIRHKDQKKGNI